MTDSTNLMAPTTNNGALHLEGSSLYVPLRRPEVTTVVLCGHAPTSRELAEWNRPDTEYWTMNDSHAWMVGRYRIDRWFEVHSPKVYRNPVRRSAGYVDHLRQFPGVVYMQEVDPEIPTSVRYPLEAVAGLTKWANLERQRGPFGSSFGWMIALGILEGFKRIEMYGCDLSTSEEYKSQRPATYYWIGRCEGAGIEFVLPSATPLLDEPFYGRDITVAPGLSKDEAMNRVSALRNQHGINSRNAVKLEGQLEEAAWWTTRIGMHG